MCTLLNCIMSLFSFGRARPGMPQFGWPMTKSLVIGLNRSRLLSRIFSALTIRRPAGHRPVPQAKNTIYIYNWGAENTIYYILYMWILKLGGWSRYRVWCVTEKMNNSNMLTARGDRQTERVKHMQPSIGIQFVYPFFPPSSEPWKYPYPIPVYHYGAS